MRFDADNFIRLYQHAGFTLTRNGSVIQYEYHGQHDIDVAVFVAALRKHKPDVLSRLVNTNKQIDLFDLE